MPILTKIKSFFKNAPSLLSIPNVIKAAAAVVFGVLLLTMLPAALPDSEVEQTRPPIAFDSKLPDMNEIANPQVFPHLVIVYPERETWGSELADHVATMVASKFHAHFITLSDREYLALDEGTLALYNADPTLTITLGITDLIDEAYLSVLSRLGNDGLEIVRNGGRIDIVSASASRINDSAQKFISSLSFSGSYEISEDFFVSDPIPSTGTEFVPDIITDGEVKLLTFSHVDNNTYTIKALRGIIGSVKPDLVIFNGGVDGGCKTRHELALLWGEIAAILAESNTPWCFTPGNLSGYLPRIVVCEVISSFEGCLRTFNGDGAVTYSLTVANSAGDVTSTVYVGDVYNSSESLCELIESDSKLYALASDYDRKVICILPAIPEQLPSLEDVCAEYASDKLTDLYDAFVAAGGNTLVCAADPAHPFVIEHKNGTLALCGSIGFSARGLGGRFDYNNSIRGGMILTLTPHRAGYTTAKVAYTFAADLGLTER